MFRIEKSGKQSQCPSIGKCTNNSDGHYKHYGELKTFLRYISNKKTPRNWRHIGWKILCKPTKLEVVLQVTMGVNTQEKMWKGTCHI